MTLVYLIAGEASGDAIGARLMAALRARRPDVGFAGVGGEAMVAQGLASLFPLRDLALMGLLEVVPQLWRLRTRFRETVADIAARRPDVVVTIDSPGFTLRVLRAVQPLGVKRVHYVAPQVWAWRESRVKHYPGLWDQLLCLLPFEPAFFARHGLNATFVGHPVLESGADRGDGARFRARAGIAADARVLVLLPGSRRMEVSRLLPVFGAALRLLPAVVPVVAVAGPVADAVRHGTRDWATAPVLVSDEVEKLDAFAAASVALTKSGTATLELAMADVPMVVAYRVNPVSAMLARRLVKVPHASLLNLLTEREVVPEMIQEACTPERLANALRVLMDDAVVVETQRRGFREVLGMLRPPGGMPSEAAAEAVLGQIKEGFTQMSGDAHKARR
jgi:lipid-A-disaccharide synthase